MGKSSTIAKATERVRAEGGIVAWVDLATATALTDVSNRLLRSLSGELGSLRDRLLELARSVRPQVSLRFDDTTGLPVVSFGVELRRRPVEDQRLALESVLDAVEGFSAGHDSPVAVVLDEFQDLLDIGGDRADWFLRGIMQRHQHVSYVCAGSRETLIHEMLEKKRAFYKHFELLHMDPMDADHLARWIDDRMRSARVDSKGTGRAIVEAAGPRTQDQLQLAREVYVMALPRGRAEATDMDQAFDAIIRAESAVFQAIWEGFSATQQNALRALASGPDQLYAADLLKRFGIGSSAAMARAVRALRTRGVVVQTGDRVVYDSPYFRGWVEGGMLPDTE